MTKTTIEALPGKWREIAEAWDALDCGADHAEERRLCADELEAALGRTEGEAAAQAAGVEDLAEWLFNNQKDKLAAPWERQWEPTKAYWRGRAAERLATPQPEAQAVAWSVLQIGARGSAYDLPDTRRAFTYEHQPGNLLASRIGGAAYAAERLSAGDSIDKGLGLLKALQESGFGIFQIGPCEEAHPTTPAVGVEVVDKYLALTMRHLGAGQDADGSDCETLWRKMNQDQRDEANRLVSLAVNSFTPEPSSEGVTDKREVRNVDRQLLHWHGVPVMVTGSISTHPSNWKIIEDAAALATKPAKGGEG